MRERVTYIIRNSNVDFDPSKLEIKDSTFTVSGINAAKEYQITLNAAELPQEIWMIFKNSHEVHLRWSSQRAYESIAPYTSRTSPGLHVFYTPLRGKAATNLCPLLKKLFSSTIKCSSPEETFTSPPILSDRFSTTAARQYYQIASIDGLIVYIQNKICHSRNVQCELLAHDLANAAYMDMDYDSISHSVTFRAFWVRPPNVDGVWHDIHRKAANNTIEVGVLMNEQPDEPEELRYSGWLTVIGKDKKPSQTLFSFPARHHPLPSSQNAYFSAQFKQPTGMHPILQLSFPAGSLQSPSEFCALHTYLTLPSYLFIDRYQLSDPLFLSSQKLKALHALSGATDLEAPDWVIREWGSAALLELATPDSADTNGNWTVSIPLHLRYLSPMAEPPHGIRSVAVPWPAVFWACIAEEGSKFSSSPFDRTNIGYDGLFGPKTMFYDIQPVGDVVAYEELAVPVMDLNRAAWVETGTVMVIVCGTLWVLLKLLQGLSKDLSEQKQTRNSKKKR